MNQLSFLIALALVFFFQLANAQLLVTRVYSDKGKSPIPFAHVLVTNDNMDKQLGITDINGACEFKNHTLKSDSLSIEISCLGYETYKGKLANKAINDFSVFLKSTVFYLNEVVITGQYSPNSPEKAVHKVRLIDQKKIQSMAAITLKDILSNETNIRLSQDNILGGNASLQGLSGENVKILIDGIPIIGRQNGNIDLSQINLSDVEQIEIVEGPMSVSYGTNALAGTINLILKKPKQNKIEAKVGTYSESNGIFNSQIRLGYGITNHSFTISGSRNFFDGWNPGEKVEFISLQPTLADSSRHQQWKPKEQWSGLLQYQFIKKACSFGYKAQLFQEQIFNRGFPRLPYGETAFDDKYSTFRFDNSLLFKANLKKNKALQFSLAYNYYKRTKNTWFKDLTTLSEVLSKSFEDQDTSTFSLLNARGIFNSSKDSCKFNYELGYDINVEEGKGTRLKDGQQWLGDFALLASAEYHPTKSLIVRPGLRYAYNSLFKAPLLPSLNLKYQIWKAKKQQQTIQFRLSYARGFRAPSLKDLYFQFVDINHNIKGNEDLKSETSNSFNGSLTFNSTMGQNIFKLEWSGYFNSINNLISLAQVSSMQFVYINLGACQTFGTQINIEYGFGHLKTSLAFLYGGKRNQITETQTFLDSRYYPEIKGNLLYEIKKAGLTVGLFYKFNGIVQNLTIGSEGQLEESEIDQYHWADITLNKSFFKNKIQIGLGCKNLFNVTNLASTSGSGPHTVEQGSVPLATGRTYFLNLEFQINK